MVVDDDDDDEPGVLCAAVAEGLLARKMMRRYGMRRCVVRVCGGGEWDWAEMKRESL